MFPYHDSINNKTLKYFKQAKCHPRISKKKKTCLDYKILLKLKKKWNLRHPDKKIKTKKKNELFNKLKEAYSNICDNEICWINKGLNGNENKEKLKLKLFAPETPKKWHTNINEWLDSTDLNKVMKQYEEKHPNFKFLGPAPIDFDTYKSNNNCVWPEICNININNIINSNVDYVGFIFNTDKHYQSGSHWFSLFLNLKDKYLFFFDSTGKPIPYEIQKLINKINNQCLNNNIKLKNFNNVGIRHQRGNTECGMYCLYFIITLLEKINNYKFFINNHINDNLVQNFRTIYFNKL